MNLRETAALAGWLMISACFAAACSEPPPPEKNHVLGDYEQSLDRARATEQQVLDAAQRQREQIESQSGEG